LLLQEKEKKEIELHEDDEKTLYTMISMMYGWFHEYERTEADLVFLIKLDEIADKYNVVSVTEAIAKHITGLLRETKEDDFIAAAVEAVCNMQAQNKAQLLEAVEIVCKKRIDDLKNNSRFKAVINRSPELASRMLWWALEEKAAVPKDDKCICLSTLTPPGIKCRDCGKRVPCRNP